MTLEQFADAVLTAVQRKAGGVFTASAYRSEKNNGVMQTGIVAKFPGSNISPCLYLDGYYIEYQNGSRTVTETAQQLYGKIMGGRDKCPGIHAGNLLEWDALKARIYPKLVNAEWNQNQLSRLPHRFFLDLAVVYYLKAIETTGGEETGTILIHNEYMQELGQEETSLYEAAMENMAAAGKTRFRDVFSVVPPGLVPDYNEPKMYILSNPFFCFGAAEILNEETLERIHSQIGDFILLPSSIFEVIIVPESQYGDGYRTLAGMVKEINETVLEPEEKLSDHVYVYHNNEKRLRIAE